MPGIASIIDMAVNAAVSSVVKDITGKLLLYSVDMQKINLITMKMIGWDNTQGETT